MNQPQSIQQVQVRRVSKLRVKRAEVFTIGPRKALMEQLEARAAIQPVAPNTGQRDTPRPR